MSGFYVQYCYKCCTSPIVYVLYSSSSALGGCFALGQGLQNLTREFQPMFLESCDSVSIIVWRGVGRGDLLEGACSGSANRSI